MATCWKRVGINSSSNVVPGEFMITTQDGVRLDLDGDKKVSSAVLICRSLSNRGVYCCLVNAGTNLAQILCL